MRSDQTLVSSSHRDLGGLLLLPWTMTPLSAQSNVVLWTTLAKSLPSRQASTQICLRVLACTTCLSGREVKVVNNSKSYAKLHCDSNINS